MRLLRKKKEECAVMEVTASFKIFYCGATYKHA
jgi:hypothetical protein